MVSEIYNLGISLVLHLGFVIYDRQYHWHFYLLPEGDGLHPIILFLADRLPHDLHRPIPGGPYPFLPEEAEHEVQLAQVQPLGLSEDPPEILVVWHLKVGILLRDDT